VLGYEYHPDAEAEYLEAVRYYSEIRPELGFAFVEEMEAAVHRARSSPDMGRPFGDGCRRVLARHYPYLVIYEKLEDRVFIWAVAHGSRLPGYWRERLRH